MWKPLLCSLTDPCRGSSRIIKSGFRTAVPSSTSHAFVASLGSLLLFLLATELKKKNVAVLRDEFHCSPETPMRPRFQQIRSTIIIIPVSYSMYVRTDWIGNWMNRAGRSTITPAKFYWDDTCCRCSRTNLNRKSFRPDSEHSQRHCLCFCFYHTRSDSTISTCADSHHLAAVEKFGQAMHCFLGRIFRIA